ncbi:cobalamin biosynthesis protein [Halomonas sp. M4R5S39]|uniref:cobalamin biosynthesis protein n=1 Tax=Halomonas kalidii TaxID=3043293 RepID=UPI0024A98D03|nr:cobalamin biosynthesis protein [Halomonas kalidii]MDI5984177.1 cobalamin biosynthesis protein [Halomonas kalidii]
MTVAGFGFRREARLASLIDALERLHAHHGAVDRLAATRTMWPLVQELGLTRGIAVIPVADAALPTATTLTRSRHSLRARGTGSVAEAVALLAAGPGAQLLGPRLISADRLATAAVARGALRGESA